MRKVYLLRPALDTHEHRHLDAMDWTCWFFIILLIDMTLLIVSRTLLMLIYCHLFVIWENTDNKIITFYINQDRHTISSFYYI